MKIKDSSTYQWEIFHKFKLDCISVHLTNWHSWLPGTLASRPLHRRSRRTRVGACVLRLINFLCFLEIVYKVSKYAGLLLFQAHWLRRINSTISIISEAVISADFAWAGYWSSEIKKLRIKQKIFITWLLCWSLHLIYSLCLSGCLARLPFLANQLAFLHIYCK